MNNVAFINQESKEWREYFGKPRGKPRIAVLLNHMKELAPKILAGTATHRDMRLYCMFKDDYLKMRKLEVIR